MSSKMESFKCTYRKANGTVSTAYVDGDDERAHGVDKHTDEPVVIVWHSDGRGRGEWREVTAGEPLGLSDQDAADLEKMAAEDTSIPKTVATATYYLDGLVPDDAEHGPRMATALEEYLKRLCLAKDEGTVTAVDGAVVDNPDIAPPLGFRVYRASVSLEDHDADTFDVVVDDVEPTIANDTLTILDLVEDAPDTTVEEYVEIEPSVQRRLDDFAEAAQRQAASEVELYPHNGVRPARGALADLVLCFACNDYYPRSAPSHVVAGTRKP